MENEQTLEVTQTPPAVKSQTLFSDDFFCIASTAIIVWSYAIINIAAFMA